MGLLDWLFGWRRKPSSAARFRELLETIPEILAAGGRAFAAKRGFIDLAIAGGLDKAIEQHDYERARQLIDAGANVHGVFEDDLTPWRKGALYDNQDIAKNLIEKGAKVGNPAMGKPTAIYPACAAGQAATVRLPIEKGAELRNRNCCPTPLPVLRAASGNVEVQKLFKEAGIEMPERPRSEQLQPPIEQGLKQFALAMILSGTDRKVVVEDLFANGASDDRAELEATVESAIASLADLPEFLQLLQPIKDGPFPDMSGALKIQVFGLYLSVLQIFEANSDTSRAWARASAQLQESLRVSPEVAKTIIRQAFILHPWIEEIKDTHGHVKKGGRA